MTVPESANRKDWPRIVAKEVNRAIRAIAALQTTDTGNEEAITALQDADVVLTAAIEALETDVAAIEADVTALQTATNWSALVNYADDAAAATGGVPVGSLYRTNSIVKVRVA